MEDKRLAAEAKQKADEERAEALVEELKGLVVRTEEQSARLMEMARPLGGLPEKKKPVVAKVVKKTDEEDKEKEEEKKEPVLGDPSKMDDEELLAAADALE